MLGGPISGTPIGALFEEFEALVSKTRTHDATLAAELVLEKSKSPDGSCIEVIAPVWMSIYLAIKANPDLLFEFSKHPRKFEEFIAGAYKAAGWDDVILTPRSGDEGRDVIAVKRGYGSIRFLEQTKAYRKGHLVTNDEVSAMLGVAQTDPNCSKVLVTTTSDFQPSVLSGRRFKELMPHRLELKNGQQIVDWLGQIANAKHK